jgi:hypothetical protein
VLLAYFLTIATVPYFAWLVLRVLLTNTVLADQIRGAIIGGTAEMPFTPECAVALFQDIRI